MWKRWLKLFSFVEYIILTLNCNKSICLVIESPLKGIRTSLVWTSKDVVSHIEKEAMGLSIFNPLSPDSDQHQFSPNNIQWLSRDTVKRINKLMITKTKYLDLLLNSLDWFLKEMYADQFGEFVCWYWDLKGFTIVFVIFHVIVTVSTHLHVAQWRIQGGHPPAPYFWIKLRPEGPKKIFETWPPFI